MTIFFRLLATDDKGTALHQAIQQLAQKQPNPNTFAVEPESFQQVPGAPFAYWLSVSLFKAFQDLPRVGKNFTVRSGSVTFDDFRFLRGTWEIPIWMRNIFNETRWQLISKGGEFSQYYFNFHLLIDWKDNGNYVAQCVYNHRPREGYGWGDKGRNLDFFGKKSITWSRRSQKGFSARILPAGCVFSDKSPVIQNADESRLLYFLILANTPVFCSLVQTQIAFGSYEVGAIERIPVPEYPVETVDTITTLARRAWSLKRHLDTVTQTSYAFVLPALLQVSGSSLSARATTWAEKVTAIETELTQIQTQIDEIVFDLYGIAENDQVAVNNEPIVVAEPEPDEEEESAISADLPSLTSELLAYLLSVAFGRFDVRLATGDRPHPSEPEPFDPLPVCSPGMLVVNSDQWAVGSEESDQWAVGSGQQEKLTTEHRPPTTHSASDIEQEICQILKVGSLRDYFRKPTAFFNEHLSRYSKSRRQAPIYLPLSTRSGNYTLWLYYHRLTDQTLYTCINDYVEPKLARMKEQIEGIRRVVDSGQWAVSSEQKKAPTTEHRPLNTEIERLQDLESELEDFRDALQRIAQFWKPNLNDGVQITLSPLWSLFRLGKWQKKLKETWDKLEKGDYDWAHLAYSIWAKRVEEKCKKDKSLAIAHNLEHLYETPPETPKSTQRKKKE